MTTITHLKWPFHGYGKVVLSPGVSPLTHQYLIADPALLSCLLGEQLFPDHLWGNSFCFFWTEIRKRTQNSFSSKWEKQMHMLAKILFHLILKFQYFHRFNKDGHLLQDMILFFNNDDFFPKTWLTKKLSSLLLWGHFQMFLFLYRQLRPAPLSQHLLNLEEKHFY